MIHQDLLAGVGCTLFETSNPSFVYIFLYPGSQADCSVGIEVRFCILLLL